MTEQQATPGGDYNLVPYVSRPFPQSQPSRLAALGSIFGLQPPDVARARVLELGCASGGNLIPLAARFPAAQFRGIDLTLRHVREAQERITALGLANIVIEQGDIAALVLGKERFDYIVCHGVYSWVPAVVREAILRIASANLADNGIAYISYNVFPGWQMRGIIRDMMIYHAGTGGDPNTRVAKARWVLDNIAQSSREGSPYGEMLRGEAKALAGMDDAYILSEFLAEENAPCYFRDFAAKAEQQGLVYLCETELSQCIPEHISAEVGALVRTMSQNNLIPLEQYMDFFRGRSFRQTLLVKAEQAPAIKRTLVHERVEGLNISGKLLCETQSDGTWRLSSQYGGSLVTGNEFVRRAVQRLADVYPATRTVAQLAAETRAGTQKSAILDAAFKLIIFGLIDISSVPLATNKNVSARPTARPLPRLDAKQSLNWTTGPDHRAVAIDVVAAALLPFLDGKHDHDALRAKLLEAVGEGRIRLTDRSTGLNLDAGAAETAAKEHVVQALDNLAAAGILE